MLNPTTIHAAVAVLAVFFSTATCNRAVAAFVNGDFITYWQNSWGEPGTTAGQVLSAHYYAVFAPSGVLDLGLPGSSMSFTGPSHVLAYLPASGSDGTLTGINDNPTSTTSGTFGGDVLALHLNIVFADAGLLGTGATAFGDLALANFIHLPNINNMSVREFLANENSLLGNGPGIYNIGLTASILDALNQSFQGGIVSAWAQDHLRLPVDMRGDFNQDGTVDAADYVVWRKTIYPIDPDAAAQYAAWRASFGNTTLSSAAQAVVPEPSTFGLALLALLGLASRRRRVAAGSVRTSNHYLGRSSCSASVLFAVISRSCRCSL